MGGINILTIFSWKAFRTTYFYRCIMILRSCDVERLKYTSNIIYLKWIRYVYSFIDLFCHMGETKVGCEKLLNKICYSQLLCQIKFEIEMVNVLLVCNIRDMSKLLFMNYYITVRKAKSTDIKLSLWAMHTQRKFHKDFENFNSQYICHVLIKYVHLNQICLLLPSKYVYLQCIRYRWFWDMSSPVSIAKIVCLLTVNIGPLTN